MKKNALLFISSGIMALVIGFAACAEPIPKPYVPPVFETSGNETFDNWRKDFASRAVNDLKKDSAIIESILIGLTPNNDVVRLNNSQPEVTKPIWKYIEGSVNNLRIQTGREKFNEFSAILTPIATQKGVPLEFAISIWGMESGFGANKGNVDVVRALATLAYDGRRKELGESELLAVHDILKAGFASRPQLVGSWAGAMGHTQFMPTSYLSKAIDGDNDGIRDIWNNPKDALASTLNYLASVGWKANEPWGKIVEVKKDFDFSLADGQMRPLSFWIENGVLNQNDFAQLQSIDWQVRLLVPTGANGPKFLVGANYGAIRHYNASDSYALSVAILGDAIAGRNTMPKNWPVNDLPLNRTEAMELQSILARMGHDIGVVDGAPGARTKAALQAFQKSRGLVADGYPNKKALFDLRDAIGIAMPKNPQIEMNAPINSVTNQSTSDVGNATTGENSAKATTNVIIDDTGVPVKMKWKTTQ